MPSLKRLAPPGNGGSLLGKGRRFCPPADHLVKERGVLTRSYYLWKHEPCFYGGLKGNRPPKVAEDMLSMGRFRTCQPLIWKMRCTVFLLKPRSQATVR